jgi:DNA polymerase-3 subunit alpha
MPMRGEFVHLHVHSDYSLLDGACPIPALIAAAKKDNMPSLALTDHGNLFGAIEFYKHAVSAGIIPIVGYEAYVAPGSRLEKSRKPGQENAYHLTLLARNEKGYKNLIFLASSAYKDGFYYKPRIDKDILSAHAEGLMALSGCLHSEISHLIVQGQVARAEEVAVQYSSMLGKGHFFLELQENGIPEQRKVIKESLEISKRTGIGVVATNDIHYLQREDAKAHDILLCISTNKKVDDPTRLRMATDQFYFRSTAEMKQIFAEIPLAISNTVAISEKCRLMLSFEEKHLPRFVPPGGITPEQHLRALCEVGLKRLFPEASGDVRKRLEYELDTIEKKGLSSYFLIVSDFVNYARDSGIAVGPGRGSAAGSLVSYLLNITLINPLEYDLLFERFLNPGRNELPDIDIDFCQRRRDEVISYVREKYNADNVSHIITFGTLGARAALRDVGRIMGFDLMKDVDRVAKRIPSIPGSETRLKDAIEADPELVQMRDKRPEVAEWFKVAMKLEGLSRHASKHAAGIVIADRPLTDYVPLYVADGVVTTQFAMESISDIGLLKVDFLGLQTLTILQKAVELIRKSRGKEIDLPRLPLDDKPTYQLLSRSETCGVFQLESAGMRDLLQKMRPDKFEDLIAILALYRPGPLKSGMVDTFVKCKHGLEKPDHLHPSLEPLLRETHGVIVYQEQVMRIAHTVGGLALAEADGLRKAMGKKKPELLAPFRAKFVPGAIKRGVDKATAERIFDTMEYFGGYGFNKSHSAAYALVSFATAYLKAHYTVEFMAALLTCERDDMDKVAEYITECRRLQIEVLPPDINECDRDFTVSGDKVRFGLGAVKNVGDKALESIIAVRAKGGLFKSLFDFCARVDLHAVDKLVVESLIKCGAFDVTGMKRSQLVAMLEGTVNVAGRAQHDRRVGQLSFFGGEKAQTPAGQPSPPDISEWPEDELLKYEKECLGFYIPATQAREHHPRAVVRVHPRPRGGGRQCRRGPRRHSGRNRVGSPVPGWLPEGPETSQDALQGPRWQLRGGRVPFGPATHKDGRA